MRQKLLTQVDNPLQKELLNLFANSSLPLHFNHKGNKQFTNLQRISLIILFRRENKSIRDFLKNLKESKWTSWLQLPRLPKKSTFHEWLELFQMKTIKDLFNQLKPKSPSMTAIDGTGFDSFHRSRHYEKRVGFTKMPYAKVDLFVDVKSKKIIDFSLVNKHQHDIISARKFVKRNDLNGIKILCDGGYDCEDFHRQIFEKGGRLYAPVRKRNKRSLKRFPKGRFRKCCLDLPDFMGQRSIIECINAVLKRRFIHCLRSKKDFMKKREFAWTMIVYNLTRKIEINENEQTISITKLNSFCNRSQYLKNYS
jgi:hypothetical protein